MSIFWHVWSFSLVKTHPTFSISKPSIDEVCSDPCLINHQQDVHHPLSPLSFSLDDSNLFLWTPSSQSSSVLLKLHLSWYNLNTLKIQKLRKILQIVAAGHHFQI